MRRRRPRRPGARRRIRVGSGGSLRTTRRRRRRRRRIRFGVRRVDPVARGDGPGDRAGERVPAHGDNFGKHDGRADHRDERAREHRLARGGGVLAEPLSAGRRRRAPVPTGGQAAVRRVPADAVQESNLLLRARRALIERLVCAAGLRRELDRSFCSFSRAARPAAEQKAAVPRVARVRPQAVVRVPAPSLVAARRTAAPGTTAAARDTPWRRARAP